MVDFFIGVWYNIYRVKRMEYLYTKLTNMEFFSVTSVALDAQDNRLRVVELGHSSPIPNKRVRCYADCCHLHFIVSGDGRLNSSPIKRGQGFVVNEGVFYTEEVGSSGLEQYWINFKGEQAAELLSECGAAGIFSFESIFSRVRDCLAEAFEEKSADRLSMLGLLYSLCGLLNRRGEVGGDVSNISLHIRTAEDFIRKNYAKRLTIQKIADECHVSPKYLSRIYRESRDNTLIGFINSTRLDAARRLIERTDGNISEIAFAVGFSDPLYFSKAYRKRFGASPTEYRKIMNQ